MDDSEGNKYAFHKATAILQELRSNPNGNRVTTPHIALPSGGRVSTSALSSEISGSSLHMMVSRNGRLALLNDVLWLSSHVLKSSTPDVQPHSIKMSRRELTDFK